jgi:hypothetical protein
VARERSLRIRPFGDVYDAIWSSLDGTMLTLGETPLAPGRHTLTAPQLTSLAASEPTIIVDLDLDALATLLDEESISLGQVRLSVYVSTQFMNLGFIAFSETLDRLTSFPMSVRLVNDAIPSRDPLRASTSGVSARCLLTLDVSRDAHPTALVPTKRHSVLAEVYFRLSSGDEEAEGLDIHRLDGAVRQTEHVPDNALVYIKPGEANPLESRVLGEVMTIFLDERVLNKIRMAPNHVESRFQRGLLHQAILNDIAQQSVVELHRLRAEGQTRPTYEELKGSLLGRLLKVVEKKGQASTGPRATTETLLEEMVDRPYRFHSRIQSIAALRTKADDAFEGNEE